jgi:hypothetical protein
MNECVLSEQEMRGIALANSDRQYAYWLRNIVEWQHPWMLKGTLGWFMYEGPDGEQCVPTWPHRGYAVWYADNVERERHLEPGRMSFNEILHTWLPSLTNAGRTVAIGPFLGTQAVLKTP